MKALQIDVHANHGADQVRKYGHQNNKENAQNQAGDNAVLQLPPAIILVQNDGGVQSQNKEEAGGHHYREQDHRGVIAGGNAQRRTDAHDHRENACCGIATGI